MTPETLSELKSLLEKATPGEWHSHELNYQTEFDGEASHMEVFDGNNDAIAAHIDDEAAELIVALQNAAPDLIKAVEQRDRYRAALEAIEYMAKLEGQNKIRDMAEEALKDTKEETNESDT